MAPFLDAVYTVNKNEEEDELIDEEDHVDFEEELQEPEFQYEMTPEEESREFTEMLARMNPQQVAAYLEEETRKRDELLAELKAIREEKEECERRSEIFNESIRELQEQIQQLTMQGP